MTAISNKNLNNPIIRRSAQERNPDAGTFGNKKKEPSFGFIANAAVKVLASNKVTGTINVIRQTPVIEVAAVDTATMIAPRYFIDKKHNKDYGPETLIREALPVVFNPFGPGIAAYAMMNAKGYGGISAGVDTLKSLHQAWNNAGGETFDPDNKDFKTVKKYARNSFESFYGDSLNNRFTKPDEKLLDNLSSRTAKLIVETKDKKVGKEELKKIEKAFTEHTGFETSLRVKVKGVDKKHHFTSDIHTVLDDIVSVGKKFVSPVINKQEGGVKGFVEKIVNFSKKKTRWAAGLSIAALVLIPPFNNALTKYRTGNDEYPAYSISCKETETQIKAENTGEEKKDKLGLWKAKALGVAVITGITLLTMGAFNKKTGFFKKGGLKNFTDKIEMKGKSAGMDLIKFIYGTSLVSRVLFSRDKQEANTTTLRDSCGFLNWLVFGGFVTKGVAHVASLKNKRGIAFINKTGPVKDITGKNLVTRGAKTVFNWLGNVSTRSFNEMKAAGANPKEKALYVGAVLAGWAWSTVTLGIAMPHLNNYMNDKAKAKELKMKKIADNNPKIKINDVVSSKEVGTAKTEASTSDPNHLLSFTNASMQKTSKEELFASFMNKNHKLI